MQKFDQMQQRMGFPKVKSFFGLSLHTGTFIIARLSLVGNIVCFFFFLYTLVMDLRFMEVGFEISFFLGSLLTMLTSCLFMFLISRWNDTHLP